MKIIMLGANHVSISLAENLASEANDITLVDLPKVGDLVTKGQRFGTIESVKSVSDLYAPVSGKIVKVNAALADTPELVNSEPYAGGWMVEIEPSDRTDLDDLLSAEAYGKLADG